MVEPPRSGLFGQALIVVDATGQLVRVGVD
jgi:hypothetical protein